MLTSWIITNVFILHLIFKGKVQMFHKQQLDRFLFLMLVVSTVSISSLFRPTNVQADGVIIPDPICFRCPVPPPPPPDVPYLTVQSHQVQVTIEGQVATTRVDQIFRNDTVWSMEGTYIFPLPETAAINTFSMWIDGEEVKGQIYTKEEARKIYNDIVRKRLDPALLEYVGRDLFQASIFPIEPGDTIVELEAKLVYNSTTQTVVPGLSVEVDGLTGTLN